MKRGPRIGLPNKALSSIDTFPSATRSSESKPIRRTVHYCPEAAVQPIQRASDVPDPRLIRAVLRLRLGRAVSVTPIGVEQERLGQKLARADTVCDPWHYVPVLARRPGALRNGAPFKDWVLPAAMERMRRKLGGRRASLD